MRLCLNFEFLGRAIQTLISWFAFSVHYFTLDGRPDFFYGVGSKPWWIIGARHQVLWCILRIPLLNLVQAKFWMNYLLRGALTLLNKSIEFVLDLHRKPFLILLTLFRSLLINKVGLDMFIKLLFLFESFCLDTWVNNELIFVFLVCLPVNPLISFLDPFQVMGVSGNRNKILLCYLQWE